MELINEENIRRAIEVLKPNDELFEVRIIGKASGKKIISGYFKSVDKLLEAFKTVNIKETNVYITLNKLKEDVYFRMQHDCFRITDNTTKDHEVTDYKWLFIDLDPIRPEGISSSDEEIQAAYSLASKVYDYMLNMGFSEPVKAISGNGAHLLYAIDMPNNPENEELVKNCLAALSMLFDNSKVKIDVVNHNPARICKLYGTLAQKGINSAERTHRMSRITSIPDEIKVTDRSILESLVNGLQHEQPKQTIKSHSTKNKFDLEEWMDRYGLKAIEKKAGTNCTMYLLAECPFDSSHVNGDSKFFLYDDGKISFKCHHNHCSQYEWQDVRLKYEPDAYDYKMDEERIEAGYQKRKKDKEEGVISPAVVEEKPKEKKRGKRKLKTVADLLKKDLPEPKVFVGVGSELPFLVEGTCILSAKPKLGKSWLVLAMCIAVSTGADFLGYKTNKCSCLYLDLETSEQLQQKRVKKVLRGNPVPGNFYMDTETDNLDNGFVEQIEDYLKQDPNIGIVVIDVFQIIRSKSVNQKESEYEHVYRDITPLNELAQKNHLAIVLVCHDRKMVDVDDPFSNILGSTGLQGAATQMMVMFRAHKNDPIHISVKGKTIDGLPDMDVELNNGQWAVVEGVNRAEEEKKRFEFEYMDSKIRLAVIKLTENGTWKGRCKDLVNDAVNRGVAITESNKDIGGFLHKHQGRFLEEDGIKIQIIDNGSGPKIYKISGSPLMTIDENPFDNEKVSVYAGFS